MFILIGEVITGEQLIGEASDDAASLIMQSGFKEPAMKHGRSRVSLCREVS